MLPNKFECSPFRFFQPSGTFCHGDAEADAAQMRALPVRGEGRAAPERAREAARVQRALHVRGVHLQPRHSEGTWWFTSVQLYNLSNHNSIEAVILSNPYKTNGMLVLRLLVFVFRSLRATPGATTGESCRSTVPPKRQRLTRWSARQASPVIRRWSVPFGQDLFWPISVLVLLAHLSVVFRNIR